MKCCNIRSLSIHSHSSGGGDRDIPRFGGQSGDMERLAGDAERRIATTSLCAYTDGNTGRQSAGSLVACGTANLPSFGPAHAHTHARMARVNSKGLQTISTNLSDEQRAQWYHPLDCRPSSNLFSNTPKTLFPAPSDPFNFPTNFLKLIVVLPVRIRGSVEIWG